MTKHTLDRVCDILHQQAREIEEWVEEQDDEFLSYGHVSGGGRRKQFKRIAERVRMAAFDLKDMA